MHLKTIPSKSFLQFSEVGWDPKVRRCAGAPRFYTIGISLYRTWNWTSRQVLYLENFRLPESGFRKVGGSIITTAGESKDPPGFLGYTYFNLIFLDTFLNAFTQELPAERAPVPSIRTIKHHPFPGKWRGIPVLRFLRCSEFRLNPRIWSQNSRFRVRKTLILTPRKKWRGILSFFVWLITIPLKPQNLESEFPVPGPENPDFDPKKKMAWDPFFFCLVDHNSA